MSFTMPPVTNQPNDTSRCYRVVMFDPAHQMFWAPIVRAFSEIEAEAKACFLFETYRVVSIRHIHDSDDHVALDGRQTVLERRVA